MIKIPFLNKFTTDDQEFYDTQINEELKYCACSNYVMKFTDVGKNKKAILIRTKENRLYALVFMKRDYKGINDALATLRLNLALVEKEKNDDSSEYQYAQISISAVNQASKNKQDVNILSSLDELLIDNKPLREKEDAISKLLNYAMQKESGEPYLDFYKAGYDRGIQNYLSLSLYDENISINDKLLNALVFFKNKEPRVYHLVNSFMRGDFDEMFRYKEEIEGKFSIGTIIKFSQNIIQAQEELPKRKHNLLLYRVGLGVNKDKNIGAENRYESFVSFGTSGGTFTDKETAGDKKPVVYRRILRREDKAVPVDLLENLGIIYLDGTQENEFLLQPFTFKITGIEQKKDVDIFDIEEIERINPRQLLTKRIDELEEYLKTNNRIDDYEKLKQIRDKILQKSKKTIKGYNVKDIYYGLRPKKRKTIEKMKNDDFIEL